MSFSNPFDESVAYTVTTETRQQRLIRLGEALPRFLQGIYPFVGRGVFSLDPLFEGLYYQIPAGKSAAVIYFRAGNLSDDLLYLTLSVNNQPVRYFPVGPKADFHVPLSIVESYPAGSRIEICLAAPRGLSGTIVLDVGILEEAEEL